MNTSTTVTVGSGRSIHWGSEYGTICGAAHRSGRFTAPKTVEGAEVTCKRCAKIMAAKVEEAHAEAVRIDETRTIYRARNSVQSESVTPVSVEAAHAKALEIAAAMTTGVQRGQTWVSTDGYPETAEVIEVTNDGPGRCEVVHYRIASGMRIGNEYGLLMDTFRRWFERQDVLAAHVEALEVAEIHAFEQAMYTELVSEGSSPEDAREMAYSCRDVNSAWSEPTARTARYDELLRKHAGTVPFRVGR